MCVSVCVSFFPLCVKRAYHFYRPWINEEAWCLHASMMCNPPLTDKSSIVCVDRFYDPTSGSVTLDGRNIKEVNVHWLRSQVCVASASREWGRVRERRTGLFFGSSPSPSLFIGGVLCRVSSIKCLSSSACCCVACCVPTLCFVAFHDTHVCVPDATVHTTAF